MGDFHIAISNLGKKACAVSAQRVLKDHQRIC